MQLTNALPGPSRFVEQLDENHGAHEENRDEWTVLCTHAGAVLRYVERIYAGSKCPPGVSDELSRLKDAMETLTITQRGVVLEDFSEAIKHCYERIFAVVREIQSHQGVDIGQMQRESEEARWRDDARRRNSGVSAAPSIGGSMALPDLNCLAIHALPEEHVPPLTEEALLSLNSQQGTHGGSESRPRRLRPALVLQIPETTTPLPGPLAANKKPSKKPIRVVAEEHRKSLSNGPRGSVPRASTPGRTRQTKLWGTRPEVPEKTMNRLDAPEQLEEIRVHFKWVEGEDIGGTGHGRLYIALNVDTADMLVVRKVDRVRDGPATEYLSHVRALTRESEILKHLDGHVNVVRHLGFEQAPRYCAIFFEYVPGGALGQAIQNHGKPDENVAKFFLGHIMSGVEYIHSRGVIHCNLSLDNILVDVNGVCKLSDFTQARHAEEPAGSSSRTAAWIAPESWDIVCPNYSTDIWRVGCIMYEIVVGEKPWSDEEGEVLSPMKPELELSPATRDFLDQCFTLSPGERPAASTLRKHPYLDLPIGWSFTGM